MKLDKFKRLILGVQFVVALLTSAKAQTEHYTPTPVKEYNGSMSYVFLQDAVSQWLPDLYDLDADEVLNRVSGDAGTTAPLSRHRLKYLDGISNSNNKFRIEIIWNVNSETAYLTDKDLSSLGRNLRVLRDDFFTSVNVPGFIRTYKAINIIGDSKVVIENDGSVSTLPSDRSELYDEHDLLLNYYSSDWTKVLQDGTYTDLDGGKQKVVAKIDDVEHTLLLNKDGTFSKVTDQKRVPGGWTVKTTYHFDAWTTNSTILLPGKIDWKTMLVDKDMEITLVSSHIRLLNLGDKDFIKP